MTILALASSLRVHSPLPGITVLSLYLTLFIFISGALETGDNLHGPHSPTVCMSEYVCFVHTRYKEKCHPGFLFWFLHNNQFCLFLMIPVQNIDAILQGWPSFFSSFLPFSPPSLPPFLPFSFVLE